MKRRFNIIIVGAGVAGLTLAARLALGQHADALDVTVVDGAARPSPAPDDELALRVSAIATGSVELLDALGAWDYVPASRVCPYESMRVWDEDNDPGGAATLAFDAAEFGVAQLGYIVENVVLQHALLKRLDDTSVRLCFDRELRALEQNDRDYRLALDHDQVMPADLVVGADGARSFVRSAVGIETRRWPYDQTAFVTHLAPELKHRNTARQRFLRDGPLGMLPLADGRVSIVWSTTPTVARRAGEACDEELGDLLGEASDYVLGKLTVAGPRGTFPLVAQHARRYVVPRIALIGDAAHAIHPLAGQGANLGLQDAAELANVIEHALRAGLHPGDQPSLRPYERARKGANATMLHFMTGLNRLFATDSRVVGELRSAGMRLFNRTGPIRERAVKVALGVR